MTESYPNIAIVGSTASGKTGLSYLLGELLPCSYVCCDSIQMYQGFDVGSAKPTLAERSRYPHHLFDSLAPAVDYDAKAYRRDALAAIATIRGEGRVPVVVGGTGLYLRALMNQAWNDDLPSCAATRERLAEQDSASLHRQLSSADPARAAELHPNDRLRVIRALEIIALTGKKVSELYGGEAQTPQTPQPASTGWWVIHLDPPKEQVLANIELRSQQLLDDGLVAEVQGLLAAGHDPGLKPFASIGYKQVMAQLAQPSLAAEPEALCQQIIIATRQYAKRQRTWFRGIEPDIRLLEATVTPELLAGLRQLFLPHFPQLADG